MLKTMRKSVASHDESGRVLAALRACIDPAKLTRELTAQHPGDAGFARRLVDTASARLWLADGAPIADVLTVLEVRHRFELSPDIARAYAVEILSTARAEIDRTNQIQFNHRKEMQNAAA